MAKRALLPMPVARILSHHIWLLLLMGLPLAGCTAGRPKEVIEFFPYSDGAGLPDSEVGILVLVGDRYGTVRIDGKTVWYANYPHPSFGYIRYRKIKFLPGPHNVVVASYNLRGRYAIYGLDFVAEPGKRYSLNYEVEKGDAWIVEESTGRVMVFDTKRFK